MGRSWKWRREENLGRLLEKQRKLSHPEAAELLGNKRKSVEEVGRIWVERETSRKQIYHNSGWDPAISLS